MLLYTLYAGLRSANRSESQCTRLAYCMLWRRTAQHLARVTRVAKPDRLSLARNVFASRSAVYTTPFGRQPLHLKGARSNFGAERRRQDWRSRYHARRKAGGGVAKSGSKTFLAMCIACSDTATRSAHPRRPQGCASFNTEWMGSS